MNPEENKLDLNIEYIVYLLNMSDIEQIQYLKWLQEEDSTEYNLDRAGHDKMYLMLMEKESFKKTWKSFKNYTNLLKENFPFERRPNIPELISENIVKYVKYKQDDTITRDCVGDLKSSKIGKIEVKCFSSTGPISFSPNPSWDIIYFVDLTRWKEDKFICYECNIASSSEIWKSIEISKTETIGSQSKSKRRPRIVWDKLFEQIKDNTKLLIKSNIYLL